MSWSIANHIDRGLAADRPAAGSVPGKHYGWFATDTGILSVVGAGPAWVEIGPVDISGKQPLDSDLTAIAALTTTSFGRAFLTLADAAASRTAIGTVIGTDVEAHDPDLTTIAGLTPTNDDVLQRKAGAWTNRTMANLIADLAALGTTFQPLDSDLTSIAALSTTSFGRGLLASADAAALRTSAGLGNAATDNYATPAIVLGSSAAAGSAASLIHSDGTIAAFDATSPTTQAFGDAAAVGTAAFAARRDHKHAMPADPLIKSLLAARQTGTATGTGTQNLFTYSLAANLIGTTKGIRVTLLARRTTGVGQVTWTPKFGGTTMAPLGSLAGATTKFEIYIWADGATGAQRFDTFQLTATTVGHTVGALAIDSASPIAITLDIALATTTDVITIDWASVELLG